MRVQSDISNNPSNNAQVSFIEVLDPPDETDEELVEGGCARPRGGAHTSPPVGRGRVRVGQRGWRATIHVVQPINDE